MTDAVRHSRRGLIWPFLILGALLVAWTFWWFYLVGRIETGLQARAEALRQSGWTVDLGEVSTTGWPFRTRVALPQPRLLAPSGQGLSASGLVAEANAWNPDHWVIIAPDGLTLERGIKGPVAIRGDALRFSASGLTQPFPRMALELVNPVFGTRPGAEAFPLRQAARVTLETRANASSASDLDVRFGVQDAVGRSGGPVEGMTGNGRLTLVIEAVIQKATALKGADPAGVFAGWTRSGGRFTRLRGMVSTGESRATLRSDVLAARPDGRLDGTVSVSAQRPGPAIAGLAGARSGAVNPAGAAGAAAVAGSGSGAGATDQSVDLTLTFRDGRTWLGPFALAPAPKLF